MPRSPDYPDLTALFEDDGELAGWDLSTRETEADASGVAWIAESTKQQGGGQILYWEPGAPVKSFETRSPRFPASQVELVDDAVVWQEPDRVNDVLVVRRALLGCESAVVHLAQPWFNRKEKQHATNYLLEGASRDKILVGVVRSTSKPPYLKPFKLAAFPVPELPTECSP
jgi:hypothetical protein